MKQLLKCYVAMAKFKGTNELIEAGIHALVDLPMQIFSARNASEIAAYRGFLFQRLEKMDDAAKLFDGGLKKFDFSAKAAYKYGMFLAEMFLLAEEKDFRHGCGAVMGLLSAARTQSDNKARKIIARVLYLLSYDKNSQLAGSFDQCAGLIPSNLWVPWIPQLLNCLYRAEGPYVRDLLLRAGAIFPQAVFLAVKTLLKTLELEGGNSTVISYCREIISFQRNVKGMTISVLDHIYDELELLQDNVYEEVHRGLQLLLKKCYSEMFNHPNKDATANVSASIISYVSEICAIFENRKDPWSTLPPGFRYFPQNPSFPHEINYQKLKKEFISDFDFGNSRLKKIHNLIMSARRWKIIIATKIQVSPRIILLDDKSEYLSYAHKQGVVVNVPGDWVYVREDEYNVHISRFMKTVEVVHKYNVVARRIYLRGHNGKVYPYLVTNNGNPIDAKRSARILQLLRFLNTPLEKYRETYRRCLSLSVPCLLPLGPKVLLIEDSTSSISLFDIFKEACRKNNEDPEIPVNFFYERIAGIKALCEPLTDEAYDKMFKRITSVLPNTLLKEWAQATFPNASDYYTFRKQFTLQHSLLNIVGFFLIQPAIAPDALYIYRNTGNLIPCFPKFNFIEETGMIDTTIYDISFRLTPNLLEFITKRGVHGTMAASMYATAKCFQEPNFDVVSLARAFIQDEILDYIRQQSATDVDADDVNERLLPILTQTISNLGNRIINATEFLVDMNTINLLIKSSTLQEHLAQYDPAWYPWL